MNDGVVVSALELARIIFHLVTTHQEFDDSHFAADQLRFHKHQITKFRAKARALGFQLIPLEQAPSNGSLRGGQASQRYCPQGQARYFTSTTSFWASL